MIKQYDQVADCFLDEYLHDYAKLNESRAQYAAQLLSVPPEYRQGIEIRVHELSFKNHFMNNKYPIHYIVMDPFTARQQAINELAVQGVAIQPVDWRTLLAS